MSIDRRSRTLVSAVRSLPLRCPRCGHTATGTPGTRCPFEGAALCVAAEIPGKADPLLGTVLGGRYPVVGVLGRGGMGAVYRGVQEPLGRAVALKVIRPEAALGDDDNPLRRRFFREAQAIAALSHPGIVGLYDYGETPDGLLFMVMELIEGPTLRQVLKEAGRLPVGRAITLVAQVLDALAQAHGLGIVHRDLKPGNVMLVGAGSSDERAKLLDFGVAKVFAQDPGLADITQGGSGTTLGTPRYMAPEQVINGEISPQTDLYAVGVLLFALLTGKPPFDGPSAFDIQRLHQEAPVPALPAELGVPASVEAVLRQALEKRAADRPASARAMAAALRATLEAPAERVVIASVPVTAPMVRTPLPSVAEVAEPSELLDETSGHGETLVRRSGTRAGGPPRALFFGGLAVAAAAGGFLLMHLMDTPRPPAPVVPSRAASTPPPPPSQAVSAAAPLAPDAGVATTPASEAPPRRPERPAAAKPAPRPAAHPSAAPAVKVERL